ncbi:MAG: UDP-N-acetylmuramoyl-L-alanine--D-glutamate ligase [Candidatus Omnitrophica bacterium]|nr:UDP-N-acetylmuramoyl-L-alanine--D-glutamate ligase [Candidatus Omnitrophota bacterium]
MDFKNKCVTIIGLSGSGFSAAKFLKMQKAKVRISDMRDTSDIKDKLLLLGNVEYEIGSHTKSFIQKSDIVVISPGVPLNADPVKWADEKGIPVIGELELGTMFCPAPIIAVTGTNGKSTTVTLIHEILRANNIKSFLLGNIGTPICEEIPDISRDSIISLEVSSFQLETIRTFRPKVAVYLNLTQDHLDRYNDMDEYAKAKLRIFENQKSSDYAVLNHDDAAVRSLGSRIKPQVFYFSMQRKVKGAYLEGERLMLDTGSGPAEICTRRDIKLAGEHNVENTLAAALAVRLLNKDARIAPVMKTFAGLNHRFELIAEDAGIKYIDDSKGTTVDSTVKALKSLRGNVILIAGGRDKGSDYSFLRDEAGKIKCAILIGEARDKIKACFAGLAISAKEAKTMKEAVSLARQSAGKGDTILLSPMCSSFDMFKDYKDRGEAFRAAVFDELRKSPVMHCAG